MSGSSYRLWRDRIAGGVIRPGQCTQYAHAIGGLVSRYPYVGGKSTNLTTEEAEALHDQLAALPDGLALIPEHEAKGKAWIARYGKRVGLPVTDDEGNPVAVDHFRFVGFYDYDDGSGYYRRGSFAPMYRCHLADGRAFDYAPAPWQSSAYGQRKLPLFWRMVGTCADCGNLVVDDYDESGQRGQAWREQSWGDDRDFQCGLSEDYRHHAREAVSA